uniref:Uncharacterized protein n=1 Tax=Steinernema glaseri TaxID=37863 RepID=A0A1I7ZQE5_9BILA
MSGQKEPFARTKQGDLALETQTETDKASPVDVDRRMSGQKDSFAKSDVCKRSCVRGLRSLGRVRQLPEVHGDRLRLLHGPLPVRPRLLPPRPVPMALPRAPLQDRRDDAEHVAGRGHPQHESAAPGGQQAGEDGRGVQKEERSQEERRSRGEDESEGEYESCQPYPSLHGARILVKTDVTPEESSGTQQDSADALPRTQKTQKSAAKKTMPSSPIAVATCSFEDEVTAIDRSRRKEK